MNIVAAANFQLKHLLLAIADPHSALNRSVASMLGHDRDSLESIHRSRSRFGARWRHQALRMRRGKICEHALESLRRQGAVQLHLAVPQVFNPLAQRFLEREQARCSHPTAGERRCYRHCGTDARTAPASGHKTHERTTVRPAASCSAVRRRPRVLFARSRLDLVVPATRAAQRYVCDSLMSAAREPSSGSALHRH